MIQLRAVVLVLSLALTACAGPAASLAETQAAPPAEEASVSGLQFIEFYSPL